MEQSGPNFTFTRVASGNLDADPQFRFVQLLGTKDVVLCNSGARADGINQYKPQDNQHATVAYAGVSKITYGQSLGVGVYICPGASGVAVLATSGHIGGKTTAAANSGNVGECVILHQTGAI